MKVSLIVRDSKMSSTSNGVITLTIFLFTFSRWNVRNGHSVSISD